MDAENPKQPGGNWLNTWVEERMDLSAVRHFIEKKTVPMHRHSIWYYFGGMALFLFMVQVFTGILLLLYYRPTAEAAFESVQFLITKVEFGWLIRNVHSWAANLMIAVLFVHMFSAYMMKAYRKPRELTWVSGVLLLGLSLGFGFSGYLLPWNELAFFATKVGTEIVADVPVIGHWLLLYLRGGEEVTGATLTRFFGFHVAVLPMLTTALLGLHLLLVQTQGMSRPPSVEASKEPKRDMPFVPQFALRDLLGWLVILGVLVSLAAYYPWELGTKADPFAPTPAGIQPEWYFLFAFEFLKLVPAEVLSFEGEFLAIAFMGLAGLVWLLVPFLDRRSSQGLPSPLFTWFGILAMAFVFGLTLVGWLHANP